MNIPSPSNVYFFESQKDVELSGPYAMISAEELEAVTRRFSIWKVMLSSHARSAGPLGDASRAQIRLSTDLQMAILQSQRESTYPNVILPMDTFITAMAVMKLSRTVVLEPEFGEMIAEETRKWEASTPT
jgi:hypothetical protein